VASLTDLDTWDTAIITSDIEGLSS
jgi:hypothetical protein